MLLQTGAAFLLQIGASVITNWGSLIITNQGKFYYKSGQLLQIRATVITNWDKLYHKLGQLIQIGAIITNWGITTVSSSGDKIFKPSRRNDFVGKHLINIATINSWNKIQHHFSNLSLKTFSPTKIKSLFFKNCR